MLNIKKSTSSGRKTKKGMVGWVQLGGWKQIGVVRDIWDRKNIFIYDSPHEKELWKRMVTYQVKKVVAEYSAILVGLDGLEDSKKNYRSDHLVTHWRILRH